jgi:phosphate starvation-inducible protein PhoH
MSKNSVSKLRLEKMAEVQALNENQQKAFDAWDNDCNLILNGSAGTGKTYIAMAMAIEEVLARRYRKVIVVRSVVPSRDIGFLPGKEDEKIEVYSRPYQALTSEIFDDDRAAWMKLQAHDQIQFECTSFVRGQTWDNCVVIVDEMQNLNWQELTSVITRMGKNSRLILCGDYFQSDFTHRNQREEKKGIVQFLEVLRNMKNFVEIEFDHNDIVRSELVKEFIITKDSLYRAGDIEFV